MEYKSDNLCQIKIMGILNVTPDSFSDGGDYFSKEKAVERAIEMVDAGADIIDVGGESTRPGAEPVSLEEEIERTIPVIETISKRIEIPISIDTYKAEIAERALDCGATIVNDISAMRFDSRMIDVVANRDCKIILMHMKGKPKSMQKNPVYENLLEEIADFLRERVQFAKEKGVKPCNIQIDPGIGFGKRKEDRYRDNLNIISNIDIFKGIANGIVLGASRKSFMGRIFEDKYAKERIYGGLAVAMWSALMGVDIIRVHDVEATHQVLEYLNIFKKMRRDSDDSG